MFIAYEVSIELIRTLRELVPSIRREDRDLADQIRRAATSVALNLSEGARFTTGNARRHFEIAQGSAMEVKAGLAVASAWGWGTDATAACQILDRLLALLWRLTRGARPLASRDEPGNSGTSVTKRAAS
jgi:four helix bundle protein